MDNTTAFFRGAVARATGNPIKVFDWNKAAQLIKDKKPRVASAGLSEDWEWTGGRIYSDGQPIPQDDTYTYLASVWATPEIDLDGEVIDCWILQDDNPGWDAHTYWPESALEIIKKETVCKTRSV